MSTNYEHDGSGDNKSLSQFDAVVEVSGLNDMSRFHQTAVMSHFVVKRDVLSEILQDKANFGIFADMIARDGEEFDEV